MNRRTRDLLETYLLPLGLALAVLGVSEMLGLVKIENLAIALLLVGLIVASSFISQTVAWRLLGNRERNQLFHVLAAVSLAENEHGHRSAVLNEAEVLALEACAREVWIYAYDLAWETAESAFSKTVRSNLERGVPYRYLVPNTKDVYLRVDQLIQRHAGLKDLKDLLKFRATPRERLITQFGVTIYNPTLLRNRAARDSGEADEHDDTLAVFFPHLVDFTGPNRPQAVFIAVRGPSTRRIQEAFVHYWDAAKPLSIKARDL